MALYGSSKAALTLLTKAWAAEFGPAGVRVNAVSPGPTRTEGTGRRRGQLRPRRRRPEDDFTNRNTTFMTWNLLHVARMLKDAGGIRAHGNQRPEWDADCRFDFPHPEYR